LRSQKMAIIISYKSFINCMDKETKKIIGLTAREIILTLLDFTLETYQNFEYPRHRSLSIEKIKKSYGPDLQKFFKTVYYLQRKKVIRKFIHKKVEYIELSKHFKKNKMKEFISKNLQIKKPKKWDGKWRIVIFDIPENRKIAREVLRSALKRMGFHMLQKSVFVHPYNCRREIRYITSLYNIDKEVKYLIANIIEGEQDLIKHFLKANLLKHKDLKGN